MISSNKRKTYTEMLKKRRPRFGPLANAKNTKYMFFNHHVDPGLKTWDDEVIEPVKNFKYLGSWISDSEHDFKVREAAAWIASDKWEECGP